MEESRNPVGVAQVGYGYWGPNIARNLAQIHRAELRLLVDRDERARNEAASLYPGLRTSPELDDALNDESISAIVLATPAQTHFELGRRVLESGRDLFVEKPLAMDYAEARRLVELADRSGRTLMVGHVFEYNPAVDYIKRALTDGELGDPLYLYSRRVNLGRVQSDINALWSIAPHDISIALYLLGRMPEAVSCQGAACLSQGVEDVIFLTLYFGANLLCHIHASWLDPSKQRELTLVGSRKMVVYDDVAAEGKIRIYDKGVYRRDDPAYGEYQYRLHSGDILLPRIDMREPLRLELEDFVDSIVEGKRPRADGHSGLRVVQVLAAGQASLDRSGARVRLAEMDEAT